MAPPRLAPYNVFYMLHPLRRLLNAYALSETAQHRLVDLFEAAALFSPRQLMLDFTAAGESKARIAALMNHVKTTTKPLSAEDWLDYSFSDNSGPWPAVVHQWLLRVTQRLFFAREAHEERWMMQNLAWMISHEEMVKNFILSSKLLDEKIAIGIFSAGIVLGSNGYEMQKRVLFSKDHCHQMKKIYLLTGDRALESLADGKENIERAQSFFQTTNPLEFESYFPSLNVSTFWEAQQKCVTESGLMLYFVYQANLSAYLIETPRHPDGSRPTTLDTINYFVNKVAPAAPELLVISSAPYLNSQKADVAFALLHFNRWRDTRIEVAGGGAPDEDTYLSEYPTASRSHYYRKILEPFGGFIFGDFAMVARKLGCQLPLSVLTALRDKHSFSQQATIALLKERCY